VSYRHVQRLASVGAEFEVAQVALSHLERSWHELGDLRAREGIGLGHVREAARNLEATYIIRLFSEFEGLLYRHLAATYPRLRVPRTAEALINRVALRERIPDAAREAVQTVREYRNSVVHREAAPVPAQTFQDASAALNRFLRLLRDAP
jgi:hypothetical protein